MAEVIYISFITTWKVKIMKLKIFWICLIIVVVSFPSVCFSEPDSKIWEWIGKYGTGGRMLYYNKTNLTKSSDIISVWVYDIATDVDRKKMIETVKREEGLEKSIKYQHYHHTVSLWKMDCKNRQIKMEKRIDYDDKGTVLNQDILYKISERENITPGSDMDKLYEKVCVTPKKPLNKK
ncbi:MAG: surface-adhesin E family protein [Smithella sp.]